MSLYFKGHRKEIMLDQLRAQGIRLARATPLTKVRAVYYRVCDAKFYSFLTESVCPPSERRVAVGRVRAYFK
jgi:hypothetical protein